MICALLQQTVIFIVLFYLYSDEQFDQYNDTHNHKKFHRKKDVKEQTSLSILYEYKLVIPKKYLFNVVIDDRFWIKEFLGDGFTGFVRSGIDLKTGEEVAIKFAMKKRYYSLEKEFVNYLYLGADDPNIVEHGIPHIIHFGDFAGYKVLVMTKTGLSLHDIVKETDEQFLPFDVICDIAIQSIRIIEYIHSKGLIYHDVKPTNIAVDNNDNGHVFFYDFAFSEFYVDAMGEPKPREEAPEINGTPEYMARGPLNRGTQCRKDDFISLGLVLLELNGVDLPWMDLTLDTANIYDTMDIVLEQWEEHGIQEICNQSENPEFFISYFDYFDTLQSHEQPDYEYLVQLFEYQQIAKELADNLDDLAEYVDLDESEDINDSDEFTNEIENLETLDFNGDNNETSLAVIHELQWTIPEKYIHGVVIDVGERGRFIVGEYLGDGYTGFVRSGTDTDTGNEVAIKFAPKNRFYFLEKEYVNYLYLGADDPNIVEHGIPHIIHFGDFLDYKILVMTKAGPNLYDLRNRTNERKFNLKCLCKIAIQAIRILQFIHSKGLVFHDVKPQNIVIDGTNKNRILFIDFAFSEFYKNAMGEPKVRERTREFYGSPAYMAKGPLNKGTHVRKDDLISLGIVLLKLNGVYIPWMYKINDEDAFEVIMESVFNEWTSYGTERVIDDSDSPQLFFEYFDYFDRIHSHEEPNYDGLVELFTAELRRIAEKEPQVDESDADDPYTNLFDE